MTSIFGKLFEENLDRVNSSPTRSTKSSKTGEKRSAQFAKVLGDLSRPEKKTSKAAPLHAPQPSAPSAPGPVLTNLPPAEQQYARASLSPVQPPPTSAAPAVAPAAGGVKTPSEPVKVTPPQPVLPQVSSEAGKIPSMPQVVAAKRLYAQAAAAPAPRFDVGEIKDIVVTAGKYHGVDPLLSLAVAEAESAYRHDAVSADGHKSKGVFQLLDSTGQHMMGVAGVEDQYDPFDPGMNAFLGVGYLRRLMDMFKSSTRIKENLATTPAKSSRELEKLAVAAFNAGEGNVVRAQEKAKALGKNPAEFNAIEPHLPATTREYVQRVTRIRRNLATRGDRIDEA